MEQSAKKYWEKEFLIILLKKEKIMTGEISKINGHGPLLRYLGEAYSVKRKNDEATMVLQRAVRYNPHDAQSLSLLGELYADQKQGDEIALSLCEQAVNIDDSQWKHWYRLARVRYMMEHYESALEALKECLRRNSKSVEAMNLAVKAFNQLGLHVKAKAMYLKILKIAPGHKAATAGLNKIKTG